MTKPRTLVRRFLHCACALLLVALGSVGAPVLADCDLVPPQLTDLDFSQPSIDVTSASGFLTCSMTLTDELSGVVESTCSFRAPGFTKVRSCTATLPSAGDRNNGTFSCDVDFPRYAESGTWRASVTARDAAGNALQVSDFELEFLLSLPVNLNVISTPDLTPPALTAFDFNSKTPDVSAGPVDVNCSVGATDAPAGVQRIACFFQRPSDPFGYVCLAFAPSSGDRNNGTFDCNVTVQQYSEAGDWTATLVLYDEVENAAFFDGATLQAMGQPSTLAVSSSPADVVAPALADFDFNPKSLDVGSSSGMVLCSVDLTDNLAGADYVACAFESPSLLHHAECVATTPTTGSDTNGSFNCNVVLPQYSEDGTWKASLEIHDRVGNALEVDAIALAAAGHPTDLEVDCGEAAFSIRFVSKTTITWNPVADAFLYNVYRGDLADVDVSYGTCQNGNDTDPTDTMYPASGTPSTGQGFAYLVSYRLISGEAGLGTRSDTSPRVVATPCP